MTKRKGIPTTEKSNPEKLAHLSHGRKGQKRIIVTLIIDTTMKTVAQPPVQLPAASTCMISNYRALHLMIDKTRKNAN